MLFALIVFGAASYLYGNLTDNLRRQGLRTGFEFLDQPAGFQIPFSSFRSSQTVQDALQVGVKNTA